MDCLSSWMEESEGKINSHFNFKESKTAAGSGSLDPENSTDVLPSAERGEKAVKAQYPFGSEVCGHASCAKKQCGNYQ